MRWFLRLTIFFICTSCRTIPQNYATGKNTSGASKNDTSFDYCPSYLVTPELEDRVGTVGGVVGHPGLPYDLRDRSNETAPYGYLCYGACGASCNATCNDVPSVSRVYRVKFTNNEKSSCRRCTYTRKMCRSHMVCRTHDDCYRKADIARFEATHDYSKGYSTFGANYFRLCDEKTIMTEITKIRPPLGFEYLSENWKICWARYMQGIVPDDTIDCWDRTQAFYAMLEKEEELSESDSACAEAVSYQQPESFQLDVDVRPATNSLAQPAAMIFAEAYAECAKDRRRLPSILELIRLESRGSLKPYQNQNTKCMWSATGTFDITNGRRVLLFGEGLGSMSPESSCGAVCIGRQRK